MPFAPHSNARSKIRELAAVLPPSLEAEGDLLRDLADRVYEIDENEVEHVLRPILRTARALAGQGEIPDAFPQAADARRYIWQLDDLLTSGPTTD